MEDVSGLDIRTLLLPAHQPVKGTNQEAMRWSQKLLANAPCRVVIVKGTPPEGGAPIRVLVASSDDTDSDSVLALSQGCQLARAVEGGAVTLLFVRPDDDLVATQIAEKHLKRLEKSVSEKKIEIKTRIELADSIVEGIRRLPLDQFDLIIVGTRQQKLIRTLFKNIGQREDTSEVSVAVVRAAVPLANQIWSKFKAAVRNRVPQLDREQRVSLVDRLLDNSQFNFDFDDENTLQADYEAID